MKKKFLVLSISLVISNLLLAQESSTEKEIIITLGPTASKLINKNINNDESKIVRNQLGVNFDFSYNKYFKNKTGIGIGIGYASYRQTILQKGLFIKSNQTDKDNNTYESWVNADMTYTSNLNYLNIPIMFHLLLGKSKTFYGFIDLGIINGLLVSGRYSEKGNLENMAKYDTGNPYFSTLSQNNPYYGYAFKGYDKKSTDSYKFYNASLKIAFGLTASISDNMFFRFEPEITKGLSDINSKDAKGIDYVNVFGEKSGYKPTKTLAMGLNVGLIFKI